MFSGSQPHGADHPEFSGYRPLNPVVRPSSFVVRSTRPFEWKGTTTLVYKPTGTGFKNIVRKVLLGEGESDLPFQVRYFEIGRGGYSSLESHHHRHAVVVIRGRGKIFLKTRVHDLRPYDSVYIGKDAVHQFHQVGRGPFGFLCMVGAARPPNTVSPAAAEKLRRKYKAESMWKA